MEISATLFNKSYSQYYDLFNSDKNYEKEIKFVYDWAGKPESIFDIGCGTGNYWKYFPQGTRIIGMDKSQDMVDNVSGVVMCADITTFKTSAVFDCATALFDVINYIPRLDWWKNIPVEKGGYFIFDLWNKEKVDKDKFETTTKTIGDVRRKITPLDYDGRIVDLRIDFWDGDQRFQEDHRMYVHSHEDIVKACGKEFSIMEVKPTKKWQTFYKCKRK